MTDLSVIHYNTGYALTNGTVMGACHRLGTPCWLVIAAEDHDGLVVLGGTRDPEKVTCGICLAVLALATEAALGGG